MSWYRMQTWLRSFSKKQRKKMRKELVRSLDVSVKPRPKIHSIIENPRGMRLSSIFYTEIFDFWCEKGFNPTVLGYAENATFPAGNLKQDMACAAILCEGGLYEKANQRAARALTKDPCLFRENQYLRLASRFVHSGYMSGLPESEQAFIRSLAECCRSVQDSSGSFERYMLNNRDSWVLVGNSPNIRSQRLGEFIDSMNVVIRFNSFQRPPFERDIYGSKTTVWAKIDFSGGVQRAEGIHFDHVLLSLSYSLYRNSRAHDNCIEFVERGIPVSEVPQKIDLQLKDTLDAWPSTGILVIAWLHSILGPLPRERILGMSTNLDEALRLPNGVKRPDKGNRGHNWEGEIELIKTFLA